MRLDKLTVKSQEALAAAQDEASRRGHQQLDVLHLLLALIKQPDGLVPQILKRLGADLRRVEGEVVASLERLPQVSGGGQMGQIYVTPGMQKMLDGAMREMEGLKDEYISAEHILLAMTADTGAAGAVLRRAGVTRDGLLSVLKEIRGSQRDTDLNPEEKYQALTRYGRDLTELARKG